MHRRGKLKKLREAAAHWVAAKPRTARGDNEIADDLIAFGVSQERVDEIVNDDEDADDDDLFPVLPDNVEIVAAFIDISTQWRTSFSGITGLDYNAIESLYRMKKKKIKKRILNGILVMEKAVLNELAQRNP